MKGNPVLYKTLVVGVIVLFIGVGIQPAFAVKEKEQIIDMEIEENNIESEDNEEKFTLTAISRNTYWGGQVYDHIPLTLVFLKSKDGAVRRCKITGLFGECRFRNLPVDKQYKVRGFHIGYRQYEIRWVHNDLVHIWMKSRWDF